MKRVVENFKKLQSAISEKANLEREQSSICSLLWFRVRAAAIRNAWMPQNGSAEWPTLRLEDCVKHQMRAAAGAGVEGWQCEPSRCAQTSSRPLASPPRK